MGRGTLLHYHRRGKGPGGRKSILSVRAYLETVYATQKTVKYTHVSVEPTKQIFNIFIKKAVYPNGSLIQNSSSSVGFRM
jgi:hypothetical protein